MAKMKTVKEQMRGYIKNKVEIRECPVELYRTNSLIESISDRGDIQSAATLKRHCNLINKELWPAVQKGLMCKVEIDWATVGDGAPSIQDDGLKKELIRLIRHNMAKEIGFFNDQKKGICLDRNICVTYLQKIIDIGYIDGVLSLYNRQTGIWEELTESLFGTLLRYLLNSIIPNSWKMFYEKEVYAGVIREAPIMERTEKSELLIPLGEGVYDLSQEKMLAYEPDFLFTRKSNVNYDQEARCPMFEKALREIMCDDKELMECFQEIFGYTLIPNTKAEKAFYFVGVGGNGKSMCSEILTELVGKNNTVNIPLSTFSEKFGLETIINKSLNIANENEVGGALDTGNLKAITSGDTVNICRKYKTSIDYKPTIKLIFLLNTLPDTSDNTHGYYRKILIIPFNRIFREDEANRGLKTEIIQSEMSGILNWALEGAKRLVQNNYVFTESKTAKKELEEYKADQNPVDCFYKEILVEDELSSEYKKDILKAYKDFLYAMGFSSRGSDSPQRFWKLLDNAAKINTNKKLEYKKVKGELKLNHYKIDYSKLPMKEERYTFIE